MEELLRRLLDENLAKLEFGPQLLKALNILMLKILENCDKNDSFAVLIMLMRQSSSIMLQLSPEEREAQAKFTELSMKCLWKLTRVNTTSTFFFFSFLQQHNFFLFLFLFLSSFSSR
jgi:cytoskeleton-associated protein 5